jgi:hypothetical protein
MMTSKKLSHKKWLLSFFFISCVLLILIALFNCFADGVGLFRFAKGLKHVATSLITGKMVAGPLGGYDERALQKLVVENYPSRRDVVTVGSSRNMQLRKRFLHGDQDFFNHSMAAASIQDYVSVVGLYAIKGNLPKTVIISIDPWVFNKKNGMPQWWKYLRNPYAKMVSDIYGQTTEVDFDHAARYRQLINLDYTIANYNYLRKGKKLRVTDRADIDDFVREPDGSIHFPYRWRFKQDERADYPPNAMPITYLNNFDTLSDFQFLQDFARYLQKEGVKVVFLLLPFHPVAYKLFNDNPKYKIVITIEDQLRDFARSNDMKLIGSYDPMKYGLTGRDFFDNTHGHEIVAQRVMKEYR